MTKPMLKAWDNREMVAGDGACVALLAPILDEIWDYAAPDQATAFLRAVGGRLARGASLGNLGSNEEIIAAMNAHWAGLGWGAVDLAFGEDGLRLVHVDLPACPAGVPAGRWSDSIGAVLAGAYDEWLGTLGGGPTMSTHVIALRGHDAEFRYGA